MTEPGRVPVWRRVWIGDDAFRNAWGQLITRILPGETLVRSHLSVYVQSTTLDLDPMPQVPHPFWHAVVATVGNPPPAPPPATDLGSTDDVLWYEVDFMHAHIWQGASPTAFTGTMPWTGLRQLDIKSQRRNDSATEDIGIWWIWAQPQDQLQNFAGFVMANLLVLQATGPSGGMTERREMGVFGDPKQGGMRWHSPPGSG